MQKFLDSIEGLDEKEAALYVKNDDGKFELDIDKYADYKSEGLKRSHEKILAEKKAEQEKAKVAAEKAAKEARDAALKEAEEKFKKEGNIDVLKKSFEEREALLKKEITDKYESELAKKNAVIYERTIKAEVSAIASRNAIKGGEVALFKLIVDDFAVDENGEVYIKDADGNRTAWTIEEYEKKLKTRPEVAVLLPSGVGQGGGAPPNTGNSGAVTPTKTTLSSDPKEREAQLAARAAEYNKKHGV